MSHTVIWVAAAAQHLARLWLNSAQRQAITAASDEIDRLLRRDPESQGESREDDRRVLLVPPLGVTFTVDSANRIVHVLDVWEFRT
jgi:hypothetical protein